MTARPTKTTLVSAVKKRLGRDLTRDETLRLARAMRARQAQQQQIYKPRMELWDDGESAMITALFELPGLGPDDVLLDVVDGRLVVSGERRARLNPTASRRQGGSTTATPQIRELKYGTFRRVIAMPAGCTTEDLEATLEHGMLSVSWPRYSGSLNAAQGTVPSGTTAEQLPTADLPTGHLARIGGNPDVSRASH